MNLIELWKIQIVIEDELVTAVFLSHTKILPQLKGKKTK